MFPVGIKKHPILCRGGKNISTAFVSTNSITQGEQVAILWKPLFEKGINFNFAYRTFRWDSESNSKAHVHCVIIGFSSILNNNLRKLYTNEHMQFVDNINAYLIEAPSVFIESRNFPIQKKVMPMLFGNMPNDGGYLCTFSDTEKNEIINKYPIAKTMFKKCLGADEFINGKTRWCLWLKEISPLDIKSIPPILERIKLVKEIRQNSKRQATKKLAKTPFLFGEIRQPDSNYIILPATSSENRKYIPIGFLDKSIIMTNSALIVPNATMYDFGILTSNVHNAWMRAICGRLKSDYRYSKDIVYNNFPWCNPTDEQKAKIEHTAQAILDARALYPDCSLADLYDELTMPPELRKAHQENDKAVMEAYGFKKKDENGKYHWLTESETVAELMKMYQEIINAK